MRWACLASVLVVAAGLRFTALHFGASDVDARPDESGIVLMLAAMDRGEFFPPILLYGGGYFEPLHAFMRVWQALFWEGDTQTQVAAGRLYEVQVVVRAWSALLALLTVFLVYAVGRRAADERAGLLAAALLAVLPLAVREAHFAKADTAAATAGALVMAALVLARGAAWRRGILAGATTALAISTKALASVVPAVLVAVLWPADAAERRSRWRTLVWAAAAGALSLVVLNVFVLRHLEQTANLAPFVLGTMSDSSWLPGGDRVVSPLVYHATVSLRWGCGWAVTLLALPAMAYGLWRGGALRIVALLALGHLAAVQASPMVLARYFLPALPALSVLIAALLVAVVDRVVAAPRARTAVLTVVALVLLAEPLAASLRLITLLGRTDTRTLAGDWIATHLPPSARLVSWGAPPGAANFGQPPSHGRAVDQRLPPAEWRAGETYVVWHRHPLPYSSDPLPDGAPPLRSLATFDPFADEHDTDAVFEAIDAFYVPIGRLDRVVRPGPRIEILAVEPRG